MKRFALLFAMLLFVAAVFAVPARRASLKVKQSDGSELTVLLAGDEALHFYTTLDGKPLFKELNGDYFYATFSAEGQFVSTKCLAHDSGSRSLHEKALIASIDYSKMGEEINRVANARSAKYRSAAQKAASSVNPTGEVNVAVLLVEFKDKKFSYTKEDVQNIMNTPGYVYDNPIAPSIGSARDYFIAQSGGKFKPNFVVTDIVTLDYNMAYYGANDANGNDEKPSYMIKHGIQKADANFDFSIFDNNGDGESEFIYCLYAGYSEAAGAEENTVWPHQWTLSSESGTVVVDGVKFNTYACSSELSLSEYYESEYGKLLTGIGCICHEFSHCLGLHDTYDTTYESGNWGMDYWDVMDQGCYAAEGYVPVGYNAYEMDACGWRDLVEINEKGHYTMEALTREGVGYKVVNDANPNEYYVLENRKCEGWDRYLFNEGMLITHVDYLKSAWDNNTINATAGHPRFTIIPADNKLAKYGDVSSSEFAASLRGDVWPGTSGNTELTNTSLPAAKVYKGGYMNKPITNIKYENSVISFDFMAGMFSSAPAVLPATEIGESAFVANWEALETAVKYNVELYRITETEGGAGDPVTMLSEDFVNCTESNKDISSSSDSYTAMAGWTGYKVYSEGGIVRVGTSSNAGWFKSPMLNNVGEITVSFETVLYNTADTGSVLTVSVLDADGNEIVSKDVTPTSALAEYSLTANVDGDFNLQFSTEASKGKKRAKIDNISVTAASSVTARLVTKVTTESVSYRFENLESGVYSYRVQASDGIGVSDFSAHQNVTLLATGISDVVAEASHVEVYTAAGVKVYSGDKSNIPVLGKGVYVLKSNAGTVKVLVK